MTKLPKEFFVWSFNDWDNWGGYARTTNLHPLDDKERETGVLCVPRSQADAMVAAALEKAAGACSRLYKGERHQDAYDQGRDDGLDIAEQQICALITADARAAFEQAVQTERDRTDRWKNLAIALAADDPNAAAYWLCEYDDVREELDELDLSSSDTGVPFRAAFEQAVREAAEAAYIEGGKAAREDHAQLVQEAVDAERQKAEQVIYALRGLDYHQIESAIAAIRAPQEPRE